MDVSLAYRDDMFAEWTEMAHERVPRKLKCTFTSPKVGYLEVSVDGIFYLVSRYVGTFAQTHFLFLSMHDPRRLVVTILCPRRGQCRYFMSLQRRKEQKKECLFEVI